MFMRVPVCFDPCSFSLVRVFYPDAGSVFLYLELKQPAFFWRTDVSPRALLFVYFRKALSRFRLVPAALVDIEVNGVGVNCFR